LDGAVLHDPRLPPPLLSAPPGPPPVDPAAAQEVVVDGAEASTTEEPQDLLPEAEFIKTLSKPEVLIQIRVPNDPANMAWNFYGQIVSVTVDVTSKIKAVKQEISRLHLNDMPINKIQLKSSKFLKDNATLASLNIGPTATLELKAKTRAGRK